MIKEQLLQAYEGRKADFKNLITKFPDDDLAGPLLMSPNETFSTQPFPLLIVGQETNGWHYHTENLNKQMKVYEDFNVGSNYYSSPFWNVTRKVESALGNEHYSCAWTNISKFDLDGGRSYGEYESAIATIDNLLVTEINIIKPKICLFFTGPSFDWRIKKIFTGVEFERIEGHAKRTFAQLKHPELPVLSFRTYHPKYLRFSGIEDDIIKSIVGLSKYKS